MEKENLSPPRRWWHRLLSVLMALTLIVATIAWPQSAETVKAADLDMEINSDGYITWTTTTKANTSTGKRFHTIGWYFTVYEYKDGTNTIKQSSRQDLYLPLGKITHTGGVTSQKMTYIGDNKELTSMYNGDHKYLIKANAKVEFYDYDNNRSLGTASNKADADSMAHRYISNESYFNNYYDRTVKISNVKLKATCDSGLVSPTINGTNGQSTSDNNAVKWVKTDSNADLQVEARAVGGYKGYACVSANKAGSTKLMDGFRALPNQGGRIDRYTVDKNTTIEFNSKPLQVKVTFHANGEKLGTQTFTYNKTGTFGDTTELDYFKEWSLDTSGAEWSTTEDDSVGSKHFQQPTTKVVGLRSSAS